MVAWHAATNKETDLVMIPLRVALWERDREGRPTVPGELICHTYTGLRTMNHHIEAHAKTRMEWSTHPQL